MTEHQLHPYNRDTRILRNGRKSLKLTLDHESAYPLTSGSRFLCADDHARSSRFALVVNTRAVLSYLDDILPRENELNTSLRSIIAERPGALIRLSLVSEFLRCELLAYLIGNAIDSDYRERWRRTLARVALGNYPAKTIVT